MTILLVSSNGVKYVVFLNCLKTNPLQEGLRPGGIIVLKDNLASSENFCFILLYS